MNQPQTKNNAADGQSRAGEAGANLTDVLAAMEMDEFEAWWPTLGQTIGKVAAWEAWKVRGAMKSKCRGMAHSGCNYLAACGSICDKCGQYV